MEQQDKNRAFNRLLADLQEDSFHNDFVEEHEHLPKMAKAKELENLRSRLRKRYPRTRLSPTAMYMPKIALTFAIMMTCAVTFLYINQLKKARPAPVPTEKPSTLDSLMKNRNH
jgi:hypothetical protein